MAYGEYGYGITKKDMNGSGCGCYLVIILFILITITLLFTCGCVEPAIPDKYPVITATNQTPITQKAIPTPYISPYSRVSTRIDPNDTWQLNGIYSEVISNESGRGITFKSFTPPNCRATTIQYYILPNNSPSQKLRVTTHKEYERNYECHDNPGSRNISFYNINTVYPELHNIIHPLQLTTSIEGYNFPNYSPNRGAILTEYLSNAIFLGGILEYIEGNSYNCMASNTTHLLIIITDDNTYGATMINSLWYNEPSK